MTATLSKPMSQGSPSSEGVNPAGVHAFLDVIEGSPLVEPHGLVLVRHGRIVATGAWHPFTADRPHALYSLTKMFTSTALGFAIQEGLLDLDDPVVGFLPECPAGSGDAKSIRIRHLASMSTGHVKDTWLEALKVDRDEPVRGFLSLSPVCEPGSVFAYNQFATYTLATILQRVSGLGLRDYLWPRLFKPLGISFAAWQQYPPGRGYTALYVTTEAIARLGELYLRRGSWQGRRLLSEAWVAEASRPHVSTASESSPDWQQGYGFQFWMSRHGYRGEGAHGQMCLVLPEQDAVIAFTSTTQDMQFLLDKVWLHLLPAFDEAQGGGGDADRELAHRLARLYLPAVSSGPVALETATFAPADRSATGESSITGIELCAGPEDVQVVLKEGDSRLPVRLRPGLAEWTVCEPPGNGGPVPVAASGGLVSRFELKFDVLFLETPHRLAVRCDLRSRLFEANWRPAPSRPIGLLDRHAPAAD